MILAPAVWNVDVASADCTECVTVSVLGLVDCFLNSTNSELKSCAISGAHNWLCCVLFAQSCWLKRPDKFSWLVGKSTLLQNMCLKKKKKGWIGNGTCEFQHLQYKMLMSHQQTLRNVEQCLCLDFLIKKNPMYFEEKHWSIFFCCFLFFFVLSSVYADGSILTLLPSAKWCSTHVPRK